MFLTSVLRYAFSHPSRLKARAPVMTRRGPDPGAASDNDAVVDAAGCASSPAGSGAGRRLLAFPSASQTDGFPGGASRDGTRNPVLSGVRLRPGGGTRTPKISPQGVSQTLRRLPALHSPLGKRKKGPAVPTPKSNNRAAQRWLHWRRTQECNLRRYFFEQGFSFEQWSPITPIP